MSNGRNHAHVGGSHPQRLVMVIDGPQKRHAVDDPAVSGARQQIVQRRSDATDDQRPFRQFRERLNSVAQTHAGYQAANRDQNLSIIINAQLLTSVRSS